MTELATIQRIPHYPTVEDEYGFTQTVRIGNTLYLSGITGYQDDGFLPDPASQYQAVYRNIAHILDSLGATMADIAVERVYFTAGMATIDPLLRRKLRGEVFGTSFPASTWVQVQALVVAEAMIEIEVMAVLPG